MYVFASTSIFITIYLLSKCVTTIAVYENLGRFNENRLEVTPLHISASINDQILISVSELSTFTLYYLTDPEGDTIPIDITSKTYRVSEDIEENDFDVDYTIIDINSDCLSTQLSNATEVEDNEFIIGPITEFDHGNWVLSAYVRVDSGWMELYKVITIEIIEHIPTKPVKPSLKLGDTFDLSFAYPIEDIESCEIVPPRTTFDRSYDRSGSKDSCGFRITNITTDDEGIWKIIGVGRIVYESTVFLEVNDIF